MPHGAISEQGAYVYLLQDRTEPLFKIGVARRVEARTRLLPDDIDLSRSAQAWFPSRHQAFKVESVLHALLAANRVRRPHRGDGYSEWFHVAEKPRALELLTA